MRPLRTLLLLLLVPPVLVALPACDDDIFDVHWVASPDTAVIYSRSRPELDLPSAYDFLGRRRIAVEAPGATGNWDLLLDTREGELVFLAPSAVGIDSEAGIAVLPGLTFEEVREAPADSAAYAMTRPVPATDGSVYVIRSRESRGRFSQRCVFFGKFQVTNVDLAAQTVSFFFDMNPQCDDRSLVPDEDAS